MYYEPKEIKLKDGRPVILHTPEEADARKLIVFLNTVCRETDFLLKSPNSPMPTEEQEQAWVRNHRESENDLVICCEAGGRIVGTCEVMFEQAWKKRHRCRIGISIVQAYWGLGLGSAMMDELLRCAEQRPGILQMELEHIEGNDRARQLYEKKGFRQVGYKPNAFQQTDGSFAGECAMIRPIGTGFQG